MYSSTAVGEMSYRVKERWVMGGMSVVCVVVVRVSSSEMVVEMSDVSYP